MTKAKAGMSNTVKIRVVDFQSNENAQILVDKASLECNGNFIDWYEKDYGIVAIFLVPEKNVSEFESRVGNIHGVTYSID